MVINIYLYILFYAVSPFVICVSYILIVIKLRFSRLPQFHSKSKRDRKLMGTALIVSLVSLLCFLPDMMYVACIHLSFTCFMNIFIWLCFIFSYLSCKSYSLRSSVARIPRIFIRVSLQGPRHFKRPGKPASL